MLPYVGPYLNIQWLHANNMTERVRSDPFEAHRRGQGRSRRGQEEEGFLDEALEGCHECMIGSWNDYFGVDTKTRCGLLYLNENFGILGIGASHTTDCSEQLSFQ